jgi:DNA-binding MarR family transcriptional regulator
MPKPCSPSLPLDDAEEAFWRAFIRALIVVPRLLDAELVATEGMTVNEYAVLAHLSEAEGRQLRMTDLAEQASLTLSGMTRIVDRLVDDGYAERIPCDADRRGSFARITDRGFERLEHAYPVHVAGVRRHVVDHLAQFDLRRLAEAFARIGNECPTAH